MPKFPKDTYLRQQWVKFVQVKRADFVEPTEHSVICNIHFSPDCYEKSFMVQMGLRKQSPLLSGAVPTISLQQQQIIVRQESGLSKMKAANNRKWLTVLIKGPEEVELFKSLRLIG